MVDLDALARRARSTAEWSRARMAARVGAVVAPLTLGAYLAGGEAAMCVCLGALLFMTTGALRYWHQGGVTGARIGLLMGMVPTVAACALGACGVPCAPATEFAAGEWVCLGAGTIAGAGVAVWASDALGDLRGLGVAALVATMTSALGCVGLGEGALALVLPALLLSSALTWGPARWPRG
jgi:hypothetical protein